MRTPRGIAQNIIEIVTDYLAAGLDPTKSVFFQQSLVPEHAELHLLLSMVTPLGWLERVPTYKEALENVKDKDLHNYGFLGYPCLQSADIVIYSEEGARFSCQLARIKSPTSNYPAKSFVGLIVFYGLRCDNFLLEKDEREFADRVSRGPVFLTRTKA